MAEIALSDGQVALVDDDCVAWLTQWNWSLSPGRGTNYAVRWAAGDNGARVKVYMHRVVAGVAGREVVDHVNGCGLDNRRSNLRTCTYAQNAQNVRKRLGAAGYLGVHATPYGKYNIEVAAGGARHRRCGFTDPVSAARARDQLARQFHGEFAILNFPEEAA